MKTHRLIVALTLAKLITACSGEDCTTVQSELEETRQTLLIATRS